MIVQYSANLLFNILLFFRRYPVSGIQFCCHPVKDLDFFLSYILSSICPYYAIILSNNLPSSLSIFFKNSAATLTIFSADILYNIPLVHLSNILVFFPREHCELLVKVLPIFCPLFLYPIVCSLPVRIFYHT